MSLELDVIFETPDDSVDMKSGTTALQGTSDSVCCITEAILTGEVPEKQTRKKSVRTSLKSTFIGSYGQIFSLDIHEHALSEKFKKLGNETLAEIISYYLSESTYQDTKKLSDKAQNEIEQLKEKSEELVDQLRKSYIKNMHAVSIRFNHKTKIRFRGSRHHPTTLAEFDKQTAETLIPIIDKDPVDIKISVTRLNIHTGNGRLQIKDADETFAFSFKHQYKAIELEVKKTFSNNLDHNNGIDREEWNYLNIEAIPVRLLDGKIVKYIITRLY